MSPQSFSARCTDDIMLDVTNKVAAQQAKQDRGRRLRRAGEWVKAHPWWVALIALVVAGVLAVIIMLLVCSTTYCAGVPIYKGGGCGQETEPSSSPPRLILRFTDPSIDALEALPAVLRPYANRTRLDSSALQVLEFLDEDMYAAARKYLEANSDLLFLVRDFLMSRFPLDDALLNGNIADSLRTAVDAVMNEFGPTTPSDNSSDTGIIDGTAASPLNTSTAAANSSAGLADLLASLFAAEGNATGADLLASLFTGANAPGGGRRSLAQSSRGGYNGRVVPYGANDPLLLSREQWFHSRTEADMAWLVTKGSGDIIVAVVDTGADFSHPDLKKNLWVNPSEVAGNGVDDDKNGPPTFVCRPIEELI
ncbi:hypothetical protein FOA52_008499 [Chlamydomonas sp. UWO 241]|nr:hypothetical protein FOA52_008499 [Chlamydomonas sp. UWO 241]